METATATAVALTSRQSCRESLACAHARTDGRLRLHLVTSLPTHCIASHRIAFSIALHRSASHRIAAVGVLTLSYHRSSGVEPRASTAPAALACEPLLSAAIGAALSIVTAVGAAIDAPVRKVPIDSMLRSYQYKTSHGTCNATCSVPPAHLRANCRHRPTGRRRQDRWRAHSFVPSEPPVRPRVCLVGRPTRGHSQCSVRHTPVHSAVDAAAGRGAASAVM